MQPMTHGSYVPEETDVGSVFVSNYPPYRHWDPRAIPALRKRWKGHHIDQSTPLGLYVHIPFCRQRCEFCWYSVHTGAESTRHVKEYLDAVCLELELYATLPAFAGRPILFIHFGGGTPSMIAEKHLGPFLRRLQAIFPWDEIEEVTFECEPGTLTTSKLQLLRELGITRISLGVQNFDDQILAANNRPHSASENIQAYEWARDCNFPHVSIDLLCGMPGEREENWRQTVHRTLELSPDAVSVYSMEVPHNTKFAAALRHGEHIEFADWPTKLRWAGHAFETFLQAGYGVTDSRSLIKQEKRASISPSRYQDGLNMGHDVISIGASPFGCFGDMQYQNIKKLGEYLERVRQGELPVSRAIVMDDETRFRRELILTLKTGCVQRAHFRQKYGRDPAAVYAETFGQLQHDGMIEPSTDDAIRLTRDGLLQADFWLRLFGANC